MSAPAQPLAILSSPHVRQAMATDAIMRHVAYALIPVAGFAAYLFGLSALLLLATVAGACVLTEYLLCRLAGKENTIGDWSAVVTGLLLALTLPPSLPLWMGFMGGVIAIVLGKAVFGGLGYNIFNPALVGRAFLQASFPVAITTWVQPLAPGRFEYPFPDTLAWPFMQPGSVDALSGATVDAWSGATPLSLMKFDHVPTETLKLFSGMTGGSAGETCSIVILLCGAYLAVRRMLDWRIPASMLASVFALSGALRLLDPARYPDPLFMLFSGGLMFGAVFMATDMVTSPTTPVGTWIFGVGIGVITVVVRIWGGMPEGVMYAILIGNAFTPLIDSFTQPRVFGTRRL